MGSQEGLLDYGHLCYLLHPMAHLPPSVSVASVPSFEMAVMHFVFEDWHEYLQLTSLVKSPEDLGFFLLPT